MYIQFDPGPKVIKRFSCSTQLSMEFVWLINLKLLTTANSFLLNIAENKNSTANKYGIPTIVGLFIFISRENFMLNSVEHEMFSAQGYKTFFMLN